MPTTAVGLVTLAVVAGCLGWPILTFSGGTGSAPPGAAQPNVQAPVPPPAHAPEIQAPVLATQPAPGQGRLALVIAGNRRWCTYPDDRLVRPPERPGSLQKPAAKNEIFTFGYKFSVSAIKQGKANEPLMLYESPVFRTAIWLTAAKAGQVTKKPAPGQLILADGEAKPNPPKTPPKGADSLVPHWQEIYRCLTLPSEMDFDLEPGTYDVYVAFDLVNREGDWSHRMTSYLTDVPIEAARRTRLDGLVNIGAGAQRQLELKTAVVEEGSGPSAGATGP